jgi:tol-pal system protein YbgF
MTFRRMFSAAPVITLLTLAASLPRPLEAQKREDFIALQRDVAQLQDQMKQLQKSQDDKMAALLALVQQALDQSAKSNAGLSSLQTSLTSSLNEQQGKVVAPVAALGTRVDQMADELRSIQDNVGQLNSHLNKMDDKLADISSAVRTILTPPAAPPPPATAAPTGPVPPPGVSADSLFTSARSDYSTGKHELALNEFNDYLKYFPMTENAPSAWYYIGMIYDAAKQYDDAIQAFDAVLDRFPENPKSPEAMYMKGVELIKANRRQDASQVLKDFLAKYPSHDNAPKAQAHLRSMGPLTTAPKPPVRKR